MNTKLFKKIALLIVMCANILLVGCGAKTNAEELAAYAEEQFLQNDYDEYVEKLRNASGLSDLNFDTNVNYYFEYDYDKETKILDAECKLSFKSDEIDNYYTTEYNQASSNTLAKVLNNLKNAYYEEPTYTYTSSKGTVRLKITNGVSDEIHVKTSSGRDYTLSYYVDYDRVEIDGEWVYHQEVRNEYSSSGSSSSYTGSYDATLKYSGTSGVLICVSEDAMERFMTAVNNDNQGTLEEMFSEGQVAYTEQGTKCNIVEEKFSKAKVKLLDGSYAGNTVWVVIESLQEK